MKKDKKDVLLTVSTLIKYGCCVVIILIGSLSQKNSILYFLCGIAETVIIFTLGEILLKKNRFWGKLVSSILLIVVFAQYEVLKLGGNFTSVIMVTNLHALGALGGNSVLYLSAVGLAVIEFLLPVRSITRGNAWSFRGMTAGILCDAVLCCYCGTGYSPVLSMGKLGVQLIQRHQMEKQITDHAEDSGGDGSVTLKPAVNNGYKYPFTDRMPNVVLIFTEGLSQSIVEDERNIMPNVKAWEDRTIDFTDYFNHTAATFRGINGQLHSGLQFNDLDRNGLTSLQDVMSMAGYETTFINPEPNVKDFTSFLKDEDFDHFVNGKGDGKVVYDDQIYDVLEEQMEKADAEKPQFFAMYTFGTHVSQNSHDQMFGDGSNAELNKFWNDDYHFGKFMDWLENSAFGNNTLVVFTADHCTAKDADFDSTFGDVYTRDAYFCDRIPMMFWYQGVTPQKIDVQGRNSLDMAPTLLDFLNLGEPDTFLGTSLFATPDKKQLETETTFNIPGEEYCSTKGGKIRALNEEERKELDQRVTEYAAEAVSAFQKKEK